jgi:Tfp pilus assembly protein PilV
MFSLFYKKNDGFSLVETMSGIVILTIALFPALGYFTNSVQFVHQTEIRSQAMDIAADTMEYFKKEAKNNFSGIDSKADEFNNTNDGGTGIIDNYDSFTEYDIDVITSDTGIGNNKKITVEVNWNNGQKNVQLTSLIRGVLNE